MQRIIEILLLIILSSCAGDARNAGYNKIPDTGSITVVSWNLENFGKSKSDSMISYIAGILKEFDVIAIEEVVAGPAGAQAVGRLGEALTRTGTNWDYAISDPTTHGRTNTAERYAFIWKTSRLKRAGHPLLEQRHEADIEREPFLATFDLNGKQFTLAGFHAIPKSKQPETEIRFLKDIPSEYPDKNIIFLGDFNCSESHNVFNPLKRMGYEPALKGQKTSLRQECKEGDCLASEYDNVFYRISKIHFIKSGIVPFYKDFENMKQARKLSDHVPVYLKFSLN